jgi:hypothetical protein
MDEFYRQEAIAKLSIAEELDVFRNLIYRVLIVAGKVAGDAQQRGADQSTVFALSNGLPDATALAGRIRQGPRVGAERATRAAPVPLLSPWPSVQFGPKGRPGTCLLPTTRGFCHRPQARRG